MKNLYKMRFLRNSGIIDEATQNRIRNIRIAIGGLGLGGSIFTNLVRLGFEKFHVADPDTYERTNSNRQRKAMESTVGKRKDECLVAEARDINPDIEIKSFSEGVQAHNVESFLANVDWVVDVVDVFALEQKIMLNQAARKNGLPIATCGSLGLSAAVVIFNSTTPSFDELTGMKSGDSYEDNIRKFVQFIAPEVPIYMREQMTKAMQRQGHVPFLAPGVELTAAFCASEITKSILSLGERPVAPQGIYVDPVNMKIEIFEADWRVREFSPYKKAA